MSWSGSRSADYSQQSSEEWSSPPPLCACGRPSVQRTSNTEANPSRRFRTCGQQQGRRCGFFEWVDPEMCGRSKVVIPLLRGKLLEQERQIKEVTEKMVKYKDELERLRENIPPPSHLGADRQAYSGILEGRVRNLQRLNVILQYVVVVSVTINLLLVLKLFSTRGV